MGDLTDLEVAALTLEMPPDEETADYVGRLDRVIKMLQSHRKTIMDELPGPVDGKEYRIIEERYSERSYNTRRLAADFERSGIFLDELVKMDVARIQWQWTKMRTLAVAQDIGLRIAGHELAGDDEADHVGEVWRSRYKVEGIK